MVVLWVMFTISLFWFGVVVGRVWLEFWFQLWRKWVVVNRVGSWCIDGVESLLWALLLVAL